MKRIQVTFLTLVILTIGMMSLWWFTAEPLIQKSANDKKEYRFLILPNKLQVLLVSDPDTDQAAAAMDVSAGLFDDPKSKAGLAHFLEHMLFLGTEKYPSPNEFSGYLATHDGHSNAMTSNEYTSYFFSVKQDKLQGALDRFAQFFIAPTFDSGSVGKEVNAVNLEHARNLRSDYRRAYQVKKELANPAHPYHKFGTGSLDTLVGTKNLVEGLDPNHNKILVPSTSSQHSLRNQLIRFYQAHYSADRMRLVIVGKEDLDTLADMTRELFLAVPNKKLGDKVSPKMPIYKQLAMDIQVKAIQQVRRVTFNFEIPAQTPYTLEKPSQILSYLVGHEGKGSLLSYLKAKGWAIGLRSGASSVDDNHSTFSIEMSLTPTGLAQLDQITEALFSYIQLLQEKPTLQNYYEEMAKVAALEFSFQETSAPQKYALLLSMNLRLKNPKYFLSKSFTYLAYRQDLLDAILANLTADKMTREILHKGAVTNKVEKYYQTKYSSTPFNVAQLQAWKNPAKIESLHLPDANPYIIEGTSLKEFASKRDTPWILENSAGSRLWHKSDVSYGSPKAHYRATISNKQVYANPRNAAMTQILIKMINDQLSEEVYPATLVGMSYALSLNTSGISLSVNGYPEKLSDLLLAVQDSLTKPTLDPLKFAIYKSAFTEQRLNMQRSSAEAKANYEWYYLYQQTLWHNTDYLEALKTIQFEDLLAFSADLFKEIHVQAFSHGNITKQDALALQHQLINSFGNKASLAGPTLEKSILMEEGEKIRHAFTVEGNNSAIHLYYQYGVKTNANNAQLSLLSQIMSQHFYATLRSKEQLGYSVQSYNAGINGMSGMHFQIQSNRNPSHLANRIRAFISEEKEVIAQMPDKVFEAYRSSAIAKRQESSKSLAESHRRLWNKISDKSYDFQYRKEEIKELQRVQKQEILALYDHLLLNEKTQKVIQVEAWKKGSKKQKALQVKKLKASHPYNQVQGVTIPVEL